MKRIIKKLISYFGLKIVKINNDVLSSQKNDILNENNIIYSNLLVSNVFNLLKSKGFYPSHIIDVGANHGNWTRDVLNVYPNSKFTLIEPQEWLSNSFDDLLIKENIIFLPIGVGKEKGEFMFTIVDRDDSCNFRISEKEAKDKNYKQIPIKVETINDIVKDSKFGIPDFLKIDAEGLDIEVLEGASDVLGHAEVILVEASVVCKAFKNDIRTVINYMDGKGYKLFEITDLNRPLTNKVLWLVELLFIKKGGNIDNTDWLK